MLWRALQVLAVAGSMALVASTSIGVTMRADWVTVTPDNQPSGTLFTGTQDQIASFTITFVGSETDPDETFDLWCTDELVTCEVLGGSTITLTPNIPEGVDVRFDVGLSTGAGSVTLHALGWTTGFPDTGSRTYTINQAVTVTALSVPSSVLQHTDDLTATFEVESGTQSTYAITCEWGAGSCSPDVSSLPLGAGQSDTVTVTFDAGALPASYSLKLTATAGTNSDFASGNVTVAEFASVNVVPGEAEVYAEPQTQRADTFHVRYNNPSAAMFDLSCSGLSCAISPLADTAKSVASAPVPIVVQYTAGADGDTSQVTLTATHQSEPSVTHSAAVDVVAEAGTLLTVEDANFELEINRADCLSVAAGPGQVVCDDYQFVYPFTPVMRMNRPHQLGLIYNSSIAHPQGRTGLNIVLPLEEPEPDSIKVEFVTNAVSRGSVTYPAWHYQRGEKFRVSRSWTWGSVSSFEQVVPYEFKVSRYDLGVLQGTDSIEGWHISLDKRRWFGRGWWLAGYEHVRARTVTGLGDVLIWTGGDVSARVYVEAGVDTFVARTRARPDTIFDMGSLYVRRLHGGGEVRYNPQGYHIETENANGQITYFDHTAEANYTLPTSIRVPTPTGHDTIYKLDYDDVSGDLEAVLVRSGSGGWDTFDLHTTLTGEQFQIDSIVDPGSRKIRLWWEGGSPGYRLDSIMDFRGAKTVIDWSWSTVRGVITAADGDTIALDYLAASPVGLSEFGSNDYRPRPTEGWRALVDGPLSGDADTTGFFLTGWGSVRGTRDALGSSAWIDREDGAFPALPTRVRHPNGWEVTASYNALGLPDTITDRSNGAVTTYQWNTTWSKPSQITSPEGVVTSFRYDGATGNLEARVVGGFKDSLHYDTDHLVDRVVDPLSHVTVLDYDSKGNLSSEFPPDSLWTHYLRDSRGYPTKVTRPTGTSSDSIINTIMYDAMGRDSLVSTSNSLDNLRTEVLTTYEFGQVKKVEPFGIDSLASGWDTTRIAASEWVYDGLGRVTVAKTPVDTTQYQFTDFTTTMASHGDTVTLTYDMLGRLRSRRTNGQTFSTDTVPQYGWVFPAFTSGLPIAAATDTFTYDLMGNLETAHNGYSRITRAYALNGALESEIDTLRAYGGSQTFDTLAYARSYVYDLDGRRVAIVHPSWINGGTDRTDYTYDQVTGRLANVRDPLGNMYAFTYNANGQRTVMTGPSVVDSMIYDGVGRLSAHNRRIGGSLAYSFSPSYDNGGRIVQPGFSYNGFGHATEYQENDIREIFTRNAFGNTSFQHLYLPGEDEQDNPGRAYSILYPEFNQVRMASMLEQWAYEASPAEPEGWLPSSRTTDYDTRGNLVDLFGDQYGWEFSGGALGFDSAYMAQKERTMSRSYWAADGKLMVHQINRDLLLMSTPPDPSPDTTFIDPWGVYEEYWYDALGRRILKRSRQEAPVCEHTARCYPAIERYVWDGSQILWEFRQAGAGDVKDPGPTPSNGQTGHVGYVHAGGIDAPVGMIRNDTAIVLHRDYRGLYLGATKTDGTNLASDVPWPSASWTLGHYAIDPRETHTWVGSLPMGQQDHTGLNYRRNRYYDPVGGQFTQPDPIGFAGGFNLYGYAGGDPINNSDPFGLTHECVPVVQMTGESSVTCFQHGEDDPPELPDWLTWDDWGRGGLWQDQSASDLLGRATNFTVARQEPPYSAEDYFDARGRMRVCGDGIAEPCVVALGLPAWGVPGGAVRNLTAAILRSRGQLGLFGDVGYIRWGKGWIIGAQHGRERVWRMAIGGRESFLHAHWVWGRWPSIQKFGNWTNYVR